MSSQDQDKTLKSLKLDRRRLLALGSALAASTTGALAGTPTRLGPNSADSSFKGNELFEGIDTIVVLVMENRSFDHYFGTINQDPQYPCAGQVDGYGGDEFNLDTDGSKVRPYRLESKVQVDPPHDWQSCHRQSNDGKNDGFVSSFKSSRNHEVMGYFERDSLPFSYWLADNFTLCDRWFSGVMGPTWPNRSILHATDAGGLQTNRPYASKGPKTIWEALPATGRSGKNYYAGVTACYTGLYLRKLLSGINPTSRIDNFFKNAAAGTLPSFSLIDPDFNVNDDHPSHDIGMGQALIASIYQAIAQSPQWSRSLFIITYDEHGGFYDHVPPPTCIDENPSFRQLGFRVPSIVIGPTVRKGAVCHDTLEHSSIAATLRSCYGMESLSPRMDAAQDLSGCIDPEAIGKPSPPPRGAPVISLSRDRLTVLDRSVPDYGQPELTQMVLEGDIPDVAIDSRESLHRTGSWLEFAEKLGAISIE